MAVRPVVLVIDDDPAIRELLSARFFTHGGFRIGGVAADGFEGAMLAADLAPDLVVLDSSMPRWDGERAAAFIRQWCPRVHIVAFFESSDPQPSWADTYLRKGDLDGVVPLAESVCGLARTA
jgi:two-component system, OmpR family, KDP operon response regulator KdpE